MTSILSPTPRRHLIDGSTSQQWIQGSQWSPVSSRAGTPISAVNRSPTLSFRRMSLQKALSDPKVTVAEPVDTGMGRRWIRWLHKRGLKDNILPGSVVAATLVKFCVGLGSYSGRGTSPMYGDYEAQRHWMELTIHLPTREWYTYDLQYWGLDYPPLTAYVSWLCGYIGALIEPTWFALGASRGIETSGSKLYMRLTVLVLDALLYVPALIMFCRTWQGTRSKRTQGLALLVLLLQPSLLLIDFGHFQYNSVMLGLTLLSLNFFATNRDLLGAFCFVLSLGFKQMALYYAPAIGTYLLAKCIYLGPSRGFHLLLRLALVTIVSFTLLFLPWLPSPSHPMAILAPITRIFPFARGLFEDKVANFWCFSNVLLVKWKTLHWATPTLLVRISTAMTAIGFLPSVGVLLRSAFQLQETASAPSKTSPSAQPAALPTQTVPEAVTPTPLLPLLPYTLLSSSLSFFLFSFQVHEKTILLPLLPITLLLSGANTDSSLFGWGVLANNAAAFSMWPLLKRDGLGTQYIALLLLWNRLVGYNPLRLPSKSFIQLLSLAFYALAAALHLLELVLTPPSRYPDLFPVLNVLASTPIFGLTWIWSIKCCIEVGWAMGGIGGSRLKGFTPKPVNVRLPNPPSRASSQQPPSPSQARRFPTDLDASNLLGLSHVDMNQPRVPSPLGYRGIDRSGGSRATSLTFGSPGKIRARPRPASSSGLSAVSESWTAASSSSGRNRSRVEEEGPGL
ncbi:glucosyltransferase [Mycena floridula]|nr:glucosyltransferase [Mycena floridula]